MLSGVVRVEGLTSEAAKKYNGSLAEVLKKKEVKMKPASGEEEQPAEEEERVAVKIIEGPFRGKVLSCRAVNLRPAGDSLEKDDEESTSTQGAAESNPPLNDANQSDDSNDNDDNEEEEEARGMEDVEQASPHPLLVQKEEEVSSAEKQKQAVVETNDTPPPVTSSEASTATTTTLNTEHEQEGQSESVKREEETVEKQKHAVVETNDTPPPPVTSSEASTATTTSLNTEHEQEGQSESVKREEEENPSQSSITSLYGGLDDLMQYMTGLNSLSLKRTLESKQSAEQSQLDFTALHDRDFCNLGSYAKREQERKSALHESVEEEHRTGGFDDDQEVCSGDHGSSNGDRGFDGHGQEEVYYDEDDDDNNGDREGDYHDGYGQEEVCYDDDNGYREGDYHDGQEEVYDGQEEVYDGQEERVANGYYDDDHHEDHSPSDDCLVEEFQSTEDDFCHNMPAKKAASGQPFWSGLFSCASDKH